MTTDSADQYARLSVRINDESADILRRVKNDHGISTTEAVRRAIGLLGWCEDVQAHGRSVLVRNPDGTIYEVKPNH